MLEIKISCQINFEESLPLTCNKDALKNPLTRQEAYLFKCSKLYALYVLHFISQQMDCNKTKLVRLPEKRIKKQKY